MPDGRLGLIDYGQVVHLSSAQRRQLASLTLALAHGGGDGEDRVAAAARRMGFRTRRMDGAVVSALARVLFDRDVPGEGPAKVLRRLDSADPIQAIPHEYILCARVSLLLRGMSQLMAQRRLSTASCWRRNARMALSEWNRGRGR